MAVLKRGISMLPLDLRAALLLTIFEQQSQQECAQVLKTTAKAVETRVYRARKFLKDWMRQAGF